MYETNVTAVGRVATTITIHRFGDGGRRVSFRLACNERRRDWNNGGKWVDGETLYLSVNCWRALAENVEASLKMGDPIVVRGRMYTRHFETEGRRSSVVEMDATAVGPDLARCTASITRMPPRRAAADPGGEAAPAGSDTSTSGAAWQSGPLVAPDDRELVSVGARADAGGPAGQP